MEDIGVRREHVNSARKRWVGTALALAVQFALHGQAAALDWDLADGDVKIRWDNTPKYSAAVRVSSPSNTLIGNPNQDDGDRNFLDKGLVSNRVDLFSEFDFVYQRNFGFRVSGDGWYDSFYNRNTKNDSPFTYNAISVPYTEFPTATRNQQGREAELLDAFVFAKGDIDEMRWSVRAGKQAMVWGETLFMGANGIAGCMAPIDVVKLLSVPGSQFKEILRPTGQVYGSLQITPDVLVAGYYQYQWERTRLPAVASYFSTQDLFDVGGERFLLGGPAALLRGPDLEAKNSGQFGMQLRFRLPEGQTDYGVYVIRFNEKTPQLYLNFPIGTYSIAFHEGVMAYGLSASRTFDSVNLAGEVSIRHNSSLVNDAAINFTGTAPTQNNPLYPIGDTAHANVSAIWTVPSTPLFNEATMLFEAGWNRRLSVSNGYALAAQSTRDAWGFRVQFDPVYRQVLPGLDLDVPITVGYNPLGKSQAVSFFNGGVNEGGDFTIGLAGNYLNTWKTTLNYTQFYGSQGTTINDQGQLSFKQSLHDRSYVAFSVQTTF